MTLAEDFADDMTAAASALDDLTSRHETAPTTEKPPAKDYPCPHCDKVYTNGPDFLRRVNLDNHIKHRHTDRPPVIPKAGRNAGLKHPRAKAAVKAVGPEPKPKARKPAGDNLALLWEGGAQAAALLGQVPLARSMKFSAPAAGQAIDQAIAGTLVDRKIIQPLAVGAEKWEAVSAVVSLNLIVWLATNYPAMGVALQAPARRAVEEIMVLSVPMLRKKVEKDRKLAEALEELKHLDPAGFGTDDDPIGTILESFFAAAPEQPVTAEEQVANA